ncbi:MAG: phosphoribosylamine--glycine ligase [Gammaproteobacteria bacterium]|nr:MAG: phosphoribosylamine--glycine ligase [Gammaproteobacteria bacterium]
MKVLVVGGGGREHALAWKIAQSRRVETVIVAPGNAGTALEPKVRNAPVAADDVEVLLRLAREEHVGLTVVGPEAPLAAGIVDRFIANGLRCFGPRKAAAQLESSKRFAKEFMQRHGIPTARHESFTDFGEFQAYVEAHGAPIVIKADGLAAGKGVVVAQSVEEALAAGQAMLEGNEFGAAGNVVVAEDFLSGEEASFIAMVGVDGAILPLATSQDHKTRDDGDRGPNTGGMGAYSPAPVVTEAIASRVMAEVMQPVVEGMRKEGVRYFGFLYAGLMIGPDGTARVLEFNCRFGDPETQPILFRLRSDLVDLLDAALDGRLGSSHADWDPRPAVGVVMAAGGYPGKYRSGDEITGLPTGELPDAKVFHAGTGRDASDRIVTRGGRVLCVVGRGATVAAAQREAYRLVSQIHWEGAQYRHDIGHRAIARE